MGKLKLKLLLGHRKVLHARNRQKLIFTVEQSQASCYTFGRRCDPLLTVRFGCYRMQISSLLSSILSCHKGIGSSRIHLPKTSGSKAWGLSLTYFCRHLRTHDPSFSCQDVEIEFHSEHACYGLRRFGNFFIFELLIPLFQLHRVFFPKQVLRQF